MDLHQRMARLVLVLVFLLDLEKIVAKLNELKREFAGSELNKCAADDKSG